MKLFTKFFSLSLVFLLISTLALAQGNGIKGNSLTGVASGNLPKFLVNSDASTSSGHSIIPAGTKAIFDLQFSHDISANGIGKAGVETDGQYFYIAKWNGNQFYRYNLTGAFVDSFSITGVSGIRDLAYDGQYFYGSPNTNIIYKMDFTAHTLVGTITAPSGTTIRHICYDPGTSAFWCGGWDTDIILVNMSGTVVNTIPATTHLQEDIYGSAYDHYSAGGPYIWLYEQNTTSHSNLLVQLKVSTGTATGTTFDVSTVVPTTSGLAGGLCISEDIIPFKASIIGVIQNEKLWGLELKDLAVFPNDIGPIAITNPLSSVVLTNADTIKVEVKNFDTVKHVNIPITYVVDGGTAVNANITDTIYPMSSIMYKFLQPYDFSIPGHVYDIMVYTTFPGDANPYNDTINASVTNLWDVETVSIDIPAVIGPGNTDPKATVRNNGTLTTTFTATMNITGGYTSTKTINNLAPGATQQVTFDTWNAAVGNYNIEVYTSLVQDSVHSNDTLNQAISVQNLYKAYCYIAYNPTAGGLPEGPAYTYLQTPGNMVSLADQSAANFVAGGTWGPLNKWYGLVYSDNTLITMDTTTGVRTVIGNTGVAFSGITYDWTGGKMYGVAWDGTNTLLYTINIGSGAATLVGTVNTQLMINLACSSTGQLYAVSINDDNLYSINKTTAAATLVGNIGFDAAYAQDMEFDHNTGTCYMAAYNGTLSRGEMRIVNTTDGSTSLIGPFMQNTEITGFAIPYNGPVAAWDAGVISVEAPVSACGLGVDSVKVKVMNYGSNTITSLPLSYVLDYGTPVNGTITANIAPGAVHTFTFSTPADLSTQGAHHITAYTSLSGDTIHSNDTVHKTVNHIIPATPPYTMGFEPTENIEGWSIVDANNDGFKWFLATTGGNMAPRCMQYSYNVAQAANDWFITSCINLDAAKTYQLKYYYKAQSADYAEKVRVFIGTDNTVAALTTPVNDLSNIVNTTYNASTANFTVPATGTYYLGWQCYSNADMWILFIDDISITDVTGLQEKTTADIMVYPNPANNLINIVTPASSTKISILNTFGALVMQQEFNGNHYTIDASSFEAGIYFVKLESQDIQSVVKIIIAR